MGNKKLKRFAEIKEMPNVLEYPLEHTKGNWHKLFGNDNPITLELACGKGEYTIGLAKRYPDRNFIGIDIKGNRIWVGAKMALAQQLSNVFFLRAPIDHIDTYFDKEEIAEIWIIYPDPFLRKSKIKKRLTHINFLKKYHTILLPHSKLHLKTDSPVLFEFTLETLKEHKLDVMQASDKAYDNIEDDNPIKIATHYEKLDIAKSNAIFFIQFSLDKLSTLT